MTLAEARAFVQRSAAVYTIYRLPAWPNGVYAVSLKTPKELPDTAIIDVAPEPVSPLGDLFSGGSDGAD